MNGLESSRPGIESVGEAPSQRLELVGMTPITHFEQSGLIASEGVADYVRDTILPSHLSDCAGIDYDEGICADCPEALGVFDPASHEITVFGTCRNYGGRERMLETVTHEVGHNAHDLIMRTRPELAERWSALHEQSRAQNALDGRGFVSNYAMTNVFEDFAESYQTYIRDPDRLMFFSPEKYAFMRNEVFGGRQYEPQPTA